MTWNLKESSRLLIVVSSALTGAAGAAAGYVVATRVLEKKFQDRLEAEIADAKAFYQRMYNTPVLQKDDAPEEKIFEQLRTESQEIDGIPEDLVGKALDATRSYSPSEEDEEGRPAPVIINNIFNREPTPPGEEVLAALMADRDPAEPYIITKEEFLTNEPDFEQIQFTFWEGDEQLVDDRDEFTPIMDVDAVAGEDNLLRFGYGSADPNVLYVRNETLDPPMDLHITKSTGKYSVEVLAVDDGSPHLEHSRGRKFRLHDE